MSLPKKIWKMSRFDKGVGNLNAEGMFWWAQGLDFDFTPPFLRVAAKFLKEADSVSVPTLADIYWGTIFEQTNYAINMLDGKIFKINWPSWSEVHDNSNPWGGLGLFGDSQIDNYVEKGYLYYASNYYAGRYDPQTTTWTDSWQSFSVSNNAELCPIQKFLKFVCFGNQRYLAVWDTAASSWNATRITLPLGYKIKWLKPLTDYLVICAYHSAYGSALFFWDGISQTYNRVLQLPNVSAPAGVVDKNILYVITNDGWVNVFDGTGLTKLNRFPDMGLGDTIGINPDAVKVYQGLIYIGKGASGYDFSKRYSPPGLWVFNPITKALYYKHMLSNWGMTNISGSGVISVGSVFLSSDGGTMLVSWYDGSKYYIDVSNDTGSLRPYNWGAFLVTPLFDDEPYRRKRFVQLILNLWKPLPNNSFARIVVKYNTTEKYQKYTTYAVGGSNTYFDLSYLPGYPTPYFQVGDEVMALSGGGAGQIRHISSIDTSLKRIYVDETLYNGDSYGSSSYILLTPFQKIMTIKGSDTPDIVNKLMKFSARSKKIQFKIEIWSTTGYTGEWDMGLADISAVYVPDRIIK
jgi:hypothetical protein